MAKSFKHSGDLGDVIWSLPTVRALGGGILYLDPDGGLHSPLIKWAGRDRTKMNSSTIEAAIPFFKLQTYLEDVRVWRGEPIDVDLDVFRSQIRFNNLSDSHLAAFNLPLTERDTAWLIADQRVAVPNRPIVIARNVRYHGNDAFWEANLPQLKDRSVFVGHPKEHEIFVFTFGHAVEYFPTANLTALARLLAGCQYFIGNQGLPHAMAEGLKINVINEYCRLYPAAVFKRPGAQYV